MTRKNNFILGEKQKTILRIIAESEICHDVYWTGGTAPAYFYLHHRDSYDIDIFSDHKIDRESLLKVIQKISKEKN